MTDWNAQLIEQFHANNGEVANFGRRLVLLTTTGAKTGAQRVTPTMWFPGTGEDTTVYVVASKAGAPQHPAWYHNLVKNPTVHLEQATPTGIQEYDATAEAITNGPERDRLYAEFAKEAPGFAEYQAKTDRVIPIVALRRK